MKVHFIGIGGTGMGAVAGLLAAFVSWHLEHGLRTLEYLDSGAAR